MQQIKKKERKRTLKQRGTEARPGKKRDGSWHKQKEKLETAPVFRDVTEEKRKKKNVGTFVQIIRTALRGRDINADANAANTRYRNRWLI